MTKYNKIYKLNTKLDTALVIYGSNLSSTLNYPRYNAEIRKMVKIPKNYLSIFVGIILSDAHVSKSSLKGEARLQFKQSLKNSEYFFYIYSKLNHYCSKGPYYTKTKLKNKYHFGWAFTTRVLPCISELYNIFYKNNKKIIPLELYELLNWEVLAHWICGDGTYNSGVRIQTESFTLEENILLINMLKLKLDLDCSLHKQRNFYIIYIKSKSLKKNLHNLLPYIPDSMKYKVLKRSIV